jgi:hypothetical protein
VVLILHPCVSASTYLSARRTPSPDFPVTSSLIRLVSHISRRPVIRFVFPISSRRRRLCWSILKVIRYAMHV